MDRFVMLLAYVLAITFALVVSGVVPIPSRFIFADSDLLVLRIGAGVVLLVVAVIGHARWSAASRGTANWHAGLVFGLLFLISWLVFIDIIGDGLHQPTQASEPYIVAGYYVGGIHFLTPLQAEIGFVAQCTMLIGLIGRAVTDWRARARRSA